MKMTYEKYLIEKAVLKHIPLNASLELLPLCNMNCDMCYVRLSNEEMENLGRLRTADEWLTLAKQMQEAGTLFYLQAESPFYILSLRKFTWDCAKWE